MNSALSSGLQTGLREKIALTVALLAWLAGMFVDILEVDAAQYAMMSRDLMASGEWLEFYNRDLPYLDKPPLIFWLTASSFSLFGVNNFAYRLPSILFCLLTIGSTMNRITGNEPEFANRAEEGGAEIGFILILVATVVLLVSGVIAKRRNRAAQPPPPEASSPVPPA